MIEVCARAGAVGGAAGVAPAIAVHRLLQRKWLGLSVAGVDSCTYTAPPQPYRRSVALPPQEMPVTSAICEPRPDAVLPRGASSVSATGFAWSGGGRAISRVDVSADGGRTWTTAKLTAQPHDSSPSRTRSWGWTLWSAEVPLPPAAAVSGGRVELLCKAVDAAYNVQVRGMRAGSRG